MAFPDCSVLSTGTELVTILRRKPDLIDQLALCLDRKMRLIPNWKHLARKLKVNEEVVTKLEQYSDFSPTIRLFEYFEVTQPDLSIKELRNALVEIKRNDLIVRLTKAGCVDTEKVQEAITSQNRQDPSPRAGLLDDIALSLDGKSRVLGNWFNLAMKLDVPREACWKFETRSTQNPTNQLFQYLETRRPQMTLKELKEALQSMTRNDLLQIIQAQNMEDEVLLKEIMTPGSKLLLIMADKLNREQPAVENWKNLASRLDVPADVSREFSGESTWQNGKSPTKEVLEWVAAQFPDTTLKEVVKALDKIQRNDAIQIITKQFPDTVVSSLERLGSSLNNSLRIESSMDDPTGESVYSRYKREEGSLPKHENVAKHLKKPGHCGSLPDRSYLVGRHDVCEQMVKILDSNEDVEVVAPPGHGKTSVVVEVAHRMIQRGKFVVYVKTRRVTCVEDLGSRIIEGLGAVPGEDTIRETLRRIRALESKSVVLIIENIDNLLHLEDHVSNQEDRQKSESADYCADVRGKYKKDDFLSFLKDIGKSPNIHLVLTSREKDDFSVSFSIELIELQPLSDKDSVTLLKKRGKGLSDDMVKDLVKVCGGIPLVICTVLAILKRENPQDLTRRFSNASSPCSLIKELIRNLDFIAEDRIDRCLEVCFNRLSLENQDALVMMSTFPHRFTKEQFLVVFKSLLRVDLQTCLTCLQHSTLLRFDRISCHYSLHPFMRDFFSLMPKHAEFKSVFIRHYSELAVTLCEQFLSQHSKTAIDCYREEKDNIREAIAWCGDNHDHDVDQKTREDCIYSSNKAAVFLAKMMRKQEFESLFCKLSQQCLYDMNLYSACLTHIGMKIVLSCTCTPHICPRALIRAKCFLSCANDIQNDIKSSGKAFDDSTRAQCLSKLGFCLVREGHFGDGYSLLNQALSLRWKRMEQSTKEKDKVMLAACHNDLAASQTLQCKHMAAIETRINFALPDYESILGDHVFVATTLNWIGFSYQALGDYDNAIKFTKRALDIRQRLLGHHQETARSLYDLGVAYSAIKEYKSALEHLQKAAALQEEVLDTHEELILTHQAIAVALSGLGRHEEAQREMDLAGDCANKVEPLDVPLDIYKNRVVKDWVMPVSVPVSSSEQGKRGNESMNE